MKKEFVFRKNHRLVDYKKNYIKNTKGYRIKCRKKYKRRKKETSSHHLIHQVTSDRVLTVQFSNTSRVTITALFIPACLRFPRIVSRQSALRPKMLPCAHYGSFGRSPNGKVCLAKETRAAGLSSFQESIDNSQFKSPFWICAQAGQLSIAKRLGEIMEPWRALRLADGM